MFTGLVQRVGRLERLVRSGGGAVLHIAAGPVWDEPWTLGESVAVQGVCLTVSSVSGESVAVDVLEETLDCTQFRGMAPGSLLNLERALRPTDRLGGHIVQGHVDGRGRVASLRERGRDWVLRIAVEAEVLRSIVYKGSIAVDGVSLTVSALNDDENWFEVNLIPTTWSETSLRSRRPGDMVNLETDILGKYVERMLRRPALREEGAESGAASVPGGENGVTMEKLLSAGF